MLALGLGACGGGPVPVTEPAALGAGRAGAYRVLVPPAATGDRLPVVYFLHDFFGDSGILWREGVADELLRRMRDGRLPPFVLVAPEGAHGWWSDAPQPGPQYESWVLDGLRAQVEARYPVRTDRAGRAIAGISMGGFGAVKLALRRPDLYAQAASLSGALMPLDRELVRSSFWLTRRSFEAAFGKDGVGLERNDVWKLLATVPAGAARPRLVLRGGTADKYHLDEAAKRFAAAARAAGFEVSLALDEGGRHAWSYWRGSLIEVLTDLARGFARPAPQALSPAPPRSVSRPTRTGR